MCVFTWEMRSFDVCIMNKKARPADVYSTCSCLKLLSTKSGDR